MHAESARVAHGPTSPKVSPSQIVPQHQNLQLEERFKSPGVAALGHCWLVVPSRQEFPTPDMHLIFLLADGDHYCPTVEASSLQQHKGLSPTPFYAQSNC